MSEHTLGTKSQPLILIDGSSYLYRAFYALPALTNASGFPTGAIYGVSNMLQKIIVDYDPIFIAVIFDAAEPTFRHKLYPEYKKNRAAMPKDLAVQIQPLHAIIADLGLHVLVMPGVEADDIIGTLACAAHAAGNNVLISTSDKDLAQLVNDQISLANTMTNEVLSIQEIKAKFGVYPHQITDYLTLIGDKSDNIPGVPAIGPKTAAKLLAQYGSLANIVAAAPTIPGKIGTAILAANEQLALAHHLVTIKRDVPIKLHWSALTRHNVNHSALHAWAKELNFKNWLTRLSSAHERQISSKKQLSPNLSCKISTNSGILTTWQHQAHQAAVQLVTIDATHCLGCGLLADNEYLYLPCANTRNDTREPTQYFISCLNSWIKQPRLKLWHNLKAQIVNLLNQHCDIPSNNFDLMLAAYVLNSSYGKYDLADLAEKYLAQHNSEHIAHNSYNFAALTPPELASIVAHRLDLINKLYPVLCEQLQENPGIQFIFYAIEMPLIPVLAKMEYRGVLIDSAHLQQQNQDLILRLEVIAQQAYNLAGEVFNLNSPQQISYILFDKLKISPLAKTPKGKASTADYVLQELALAYDLPATIIEYRALSKLISTYTSKLPQQINSTTGRIHTSYNQTATVTGRLSSSEPNLQNIPIRTSLGKRIRQAFIAPPGSKIVTADYSQIELRLMAHIAQDNNLLAAFADNVDIHQATAAEVLKISLDQVNAAQRRQAKVINFGILYGMSAFGLARQLKISQQEAQNYITTYFGRYPQVQHYMEKTRREAQQQGYVTTIWGRKLYLPGINSYNSNQKKAAERSAINAPLQGSAADIIKMAMIKLDQVLAKYQVAMIMQVHDELVFEVPDAELPTVIPLISNTMNNIVELSVPLIVSIGYGNNWDEAHDNVIS